MARVSLPPKVFPLEYHVATLKPYLEHSGYLSVGADVKVRTTYYLPRRLVGCAVRRGLCS